ncbi:hypothetical protein FACS1894211_05610 [Clostridia bacterium]|nr:hypothetical protein FACS1894211_05610 [Clostridia bacterium]
MFKSNAVRFAVIAVLVMISVSIVSGIGAISPKMRDALAMLPDLGREHDLEYLTFLADNIEVISYIFPVFFIAVAALVAFITITRLVENERAPIGCYKTLGYGGAHIVFKYVFFAAAACVLGCGGGLFLGHFVLSPVLYSSVGDKFRLPAVHGFYLTFGIVAAAVTLFCVLAVTFLVAFRSTKEKPAELLLAKSPKAGGVILIERIPFLWRRLKFKYKSTLRNIFRYKMRFLMTVFSVLGSTALVFAGLALYFSLSVTNPEMLDIMKSISSVLIVFAVVLNALVIYNITNINIDERKREIATLKVLGYRNIEVVGYIFRELFLLTSVGVLLGLPTGYVFMRFMFKFLEFGGIEHVKGFVWIVSGALSLVSLALADLLLFRKIHRVDMNASLKTVE